MTEGVDGRVLEQRVFVNAFPKSGTHLAERWVQRLAAPLAQRPWVGNVRGNAWTTELTNLDLIAEIQENWPSGGYLKGHMAHTPEIAKGFWDAKICVLFVHRDLRDVAVSQAFHVTNTDRNDKGKYRLTHPNKEPYLALDSFEDVLLAVINGLDEFGGLVERWEMFAPWLKEQWVLPLRYEHMVNMPENAAGLVLRYVAGMSAKYHGAKLTLERESYDETVGDMVRWGNRHDTTTFRKGKTGNWRKHWTKKVDAAFRRTGGYRWLEKLGYETANA